MSDRHPVIIGGPVQRMVAISDGWWVVFERTDDEWEPTSGGWRKRSDAVAEAKRQVEAAR